MIQSVLAQQSEDLAPEERKEIDSYLNRQRTIDKTIEYGGTAAEVVLTAGAVVSSIYSLGITGLLAGFGTAVGVGNAVYEAEQAGDLNTLAKASAAVGKPLIANPDAAKLNYNLAIANLVLAGIDVGIGVKEGVTAARATNRVLSDGGADVIAKLTPEQTRKFQALASSTDDAQKQQLRQSLRQELGDDFEAANQVFEGSKLETISDAEAATIRGRGVSGLTLEQDAVADRLGNEFAQTIIERGQQGRYKKDKIAYIRQKLDSGKLVEEIGESRVRDFYSDPDANVWKNVYLQAKDAAGNNLGGQQSEIDFFVHYTDGSSSTEIVSAKLNGKSVDPARDLKNLRKYYAVNLNGTQTELAENLTNVFSKPNQTKVYENATNVVVKYTDVKTGKTGEIPLSEFINKVPEPKIAGTDKYSTKVRALAPDDTATKKNLDYIKLGVEKEALFNKITSIIDSKI